MALFDEQNTERCCFAMPPALRKEIGAAAHAANVNVSAVLREAVKRGLPLVRDAVRKQQRQKARQKETP